MHTGQMSTAGKLTCTWANTLGYNTCLNNLFT